VFTFISVLALFCGTEESDSVAYLCGSCVAVLSSELKRTKTYTLAVSLTSCISFERSMQKKTETELYLWRVCFSLHSFTQHGAQGTVQNYLTVSYKFRMTEELYGHEIRAALNLTQLLNTKSRKTIKNYFSFSLFLKNY
jgi:hypothetical protein